MPQQSLNSTAARSADADMDMSAATALATSLGRGAWPELALSPESFNEYVQQVGASPSDLARYGADLYLACGCAQGAPPALRLFEEHVLRPVAADVQRMTVSAANVDDALQIVRMDLFLSRPPRITSYSGRSGLQRWVRVVAIRALLASARGSRERQADEGLLQKMVSDEDPERTANRQRFSGELQSALEQSVAQLPRKSRTILRLFYLDGLNIEAIGAIYRVHRATVARWLVAIRAEIFQGLRDRFCLREQLNTADLRSLALAMKDELALSMDRVLGSHGVDERGSDPFRSGK